ncbi:hypothetical protein EU538_06805 [Candidatus Thorarchaeota archaeon]|nr:MAG: hypothetical protein EU538_06805 [Candidatus Thorarchaeota archaeon]
MERRSMERMKQDFKSWEAETLRKAREADDLRSLREVFYQLGDRWEWDQATGAWLSSGQPLDTIGLVLRMPGLEPQKERYVLYAVMAYSKGFTNQFDHLGDKERIIIEHDKESGSLQAWSTTGHGAMDLIPLDLTRFGNVEAALQECYVVAQPGDHALRLELPESDVSFYSFKHWLWKIASGRRSFVLREIVVLDSQNLEDSLDFKFYRYARAVIDLEREWRQQQRSVFGKAREALLDEIPDHVEQKDKKLLRRIEGLIHFLWFTPCAKQLGTISRLYEDLSSEPTPSEIQLQLLPFIGEVQYALNDIVEKSKYLKWKSVMDQKNYTTGKLFEEFELSDLAKEAFAVAIEDILKEHTLAYIGYPERATMKDKALRISFGIFVLPVRLVTSFAQFLREKVEALRNRLGSADEHHEEPSRHYEPIS